jgi:thioredoxin reductase
MPAYSKTVAIIGAGPVGLAAAAHALERGLEPTILEAGCEAGHAVRQWGHVRMFSQWEYNIDKAAQRLLVREGWNTADLQAYPTGEELVENYIAPLANRTPLKDRIRTSANVTAIGRLGLDKVKTKGREDAPFVVHFHNDGGRNGGRAEQIIAGAVIDASGTWSSPSPAGANGLPAHGECELGARVAYGMPDVLGQDRARYAGNTVAVLGAGHSAIGTLIDLVHLKNDAPDTVVIWLMRGDNPEQAFGGRDNDKLAARGELGARFAKLVHEGKLRIETSFRVSHIGDENGALRIRTEAEGIERGILADELIVATGFRPDLSMLAELRLSLDPALDCPTALAPLIDPNEHSCGTVRPHGARELAQPDAGFYIAGMKSYGRAPTFLMMTGYEQVRSIIADIAGDAEAAERVELVLPETGVCSRVPIVALENCCGSPGPGASLIKTSACCS